MSPLDAENPTVEYRLKHRENENQERAHPEVEGIESYRALGEVEHEAATECGDKAEHGRRCSALQAQALFQKCDARLQHRHRGGDCGDKEHKEPAEAKEPTAPHL